MSKQFDLSKADLKHIIIYLVIIWVWALVTLLPDLQALLSTYVDPALAGFVVAFLGIVLKKFLQDNK